MGLFDIDMGQVVNFLQGPGGDMLQDLGYGLSTAPNWKKALGNSTMRTQQMEPIRVEQAKQNEQASATRAWLETNAPDLLPGLAMGQTPAELFSTAMTRKQQEQQQAAEQQRMQQYAQLITDPQLSAMVASGAMPFSEAYKHQVGGGSGGESFFGTAVPMQDAQGNIVLGQMSDEGRWQPLQGTDGYSPAPTTKQIDTGTEIITQDIFGRELYRTPKQNREAAYETGFGGVEGKADAENAALAESVQSKLPGLRTVIDELTTLADTATYTQSGQAMDALKRELGLPVGQGAIDRASYIAIVDNQVLPLLRDTFGAAFTQREGESLRATLGDPNKSPAEKKAILDAFIAQKERDVAGMTSRMPGQGDGEIDSILSGYGL